MIAAALAQGTLGMWSQPHSAPILAGRLPESRGAPRAVAMVTWRAVQLGVGLWDKGASGSRVGPRDVFGDRTEPSGEAVSSPLWEGVTQGRCPLAGRMGQVTSKVPPARYPGQISAPVLRGPDRLLGAGTWA